MLNIEYVNRKWKENRKKILPTFLVVSMFWRSSYLLHILFVCLVTISLDGDLTKKKKRNYFFLLYSYIHIRSLFIELLGGKFTLYYTVIVVSSRRKPSGYECWWTNYGITKKKIKRKEIWIKGNTTTKIILFRKEMLCVW